MLIKKLIKDFLATLFPKTYYKEFQYILLQEIKYKTFIERKR